MNGIHIRLRAKKRTENINIAKGPNYPRGEVWLFYINL